MKFIFFSWERFTPREGEGAAFAVAVLLLIGMLLVIELLKRKANLNASVTRKVVHILTGVLIALSPMYFESAFYPALIPLLFIPVNILAVNKGWLLSLHGSERPTDTHPIMHNYGTVYYPISFLILVVLFWGPLVWILQIAMLVLAFGDALAALVGESLTKPHAYNLVGRNGRPKSIEGSLVMFGVSVSLIYAGLIVFKSQSLALMQVDDNLLFVLAISIALIATATEALLSGGMDNLFVPLSVAYPLMVIEIQGAEAIRTIVIATSITFLFVRLTLWLKFLNASGGTATFLFGTTVYSMGGAMWTVPVLAFFILSSVLSKVGKARKKKFDLIFEKGSQRDAGQVYANGGIAWLIIIWYSLMPEPLLFVAFLGTLAAVQADTWATEIGTMLRNPKPVSIVNFQPVTPGTSGGITVTGTSGAFFGAVVIALSGWAIAPDAMESLFGQAGTNGFLRSLIIIGLAGLIGSLIDSFLGATVQAMYYDDIRQKVTERTHSRKEDGTEVENKLIKGYLWADNDLVNLCCAVAGAGMAVFLLSLI